MLFGDTSDESSAKLSNHLFNNAKAAVKEMVLRNNPRHSFPDQGIVTIFFLVTKGAYTEQAAVKRFF